MMFWGGLNILIVLLHRGITLDRLAKISVSERDAEDVFRRLKTSNGLKWSSSLLNFFMSPITIWFWEHLAAVGQWEFALSPGNTSLFFFAQIQEQGIKGLSIFMTIASNINFLWFNYLILPLRSDPTLQENSLESMLGGLIWLFLNLFLCLYGCAMILSRCCQWLLLLP